MKYNMNHDLMAFIALSSLMFDAQANHIPNQETISSAPSESFHPIVTSNPFTPKVTSHIEFPNDMPVDKFGQYDEKQAYINYKQLDLEAKKEQIHRVFDDVYNSGFKKEHQNQLVDIIYSSNPTKATELKQVDMTQIMNQLQNGIHPHSKQEISFPSTLAFSFTLLGLLAGMAVKPNKSAYVFICCSTLSMAMCIQSYRSNVKEQAIEVLTSFDTYNQLQKDRYKTYVEQSIKKEPKHQTNNQKTALNQAIIMNMDYTNC